MAESPNQLALFPISSQAVISENTPSRNTSNSVESTDRAFHDWYRFVLSFPPHLVRDYLRDFQLKEGDTILDPFCGTGTTIVEAKLNQFRGIGLEANPFPQFASSVKVDWAVDPESILANSYEIAERVAGELKTQGIDDNQPFASYEGIELRDLLPDAKGLLIANSISPLPLHKVLVLLDSIREHVGQSYYQHILLALGKALVSSISNLRFGPEVGVGKKKRDIPVLASWLAEVEKIASDLILVQSQQFPDATIHLADAREIAQVLQPNSVDAVITSPPYPNEKDYTRATRLESVILGFYEANSQLRGFKKKLVRSNTRGIYRSDNDHVWVAHIPEIQQLANEIERRRVELGKTSGFEKLYGRLTRLYFGGMAKHLSELRTVLRPNAQLAYVVGDQASYFRVMIRTGELLAQIAQQLGYDLVRIDLFRTRFATATQTDLREEVIVLRWPG
jgi:hypothetical protein